MRENEFVQLKIRQIKEYVDAELRKYPQVKGVVVVGSVSEGTCKEDSDIDAYVFFEPLDLAIMPGEFRWDPTTGEYYTIFEGKGTVQIDAKRVALERMRNIEWPEEWKHELATGIVVYDPEGRVKKLIDQKATYSEHLRLNVIMESILRIDNSYLNEWATITKWIKKGDFLVAHEQLNVGLEEILKILYAYNRTFMPYRSKGLINSFDLQWLPDQYVDSLKEFIVIRELDESDVMRRLTTIKRIFDRVLEKLIRDGILPRDNPIGYTFGQIHKEIGYAETMNAWLKAHEERATNA